MDLEDIEESSTCDDFAFLEICATMTTYLSNVVIIVGSKMAKLRADIDPEGGGGKTHFFGDGTDIRPRGQRVLHKSHESTVLMSSPFEVSVDLHVDAKDLNLDNIIVSIADFETKATGGPTRKISEGFLIKAITKSIQSELAVGFREQLLSFTEAYSVALRETATKGSDPKLNDALNRSLVIDRILSSCEMANQKEACILLGLSTANPSSTMTRVASKTEMLRFTVNGRAVFPLFQFDVDERRIQPVISKLIEMKPKNWSRIRLLHWLTRPHLDFEGVPPASEIGLRDEDIVAAYEREIGELEAL